MGLSRSSTVSTVVPVLVLVLVLTVLFTVVVCMFEIRSVGRLERVFNI